MKLRLIHHRQQYTLQDKFGCLQEKTHWLLFRPSCCNLPRRLGLYCTTRMQDVLLFHDHKVGLVRLFVALSLIHTILLCPPLNITVGNAGAKFQALLYLDQSISWKAHTEVNCTLSARNLRHLNSQPVELRNRLCTVLPILPRHSILSHKSKRQHLSRLEQTSPR